MKFLPTWRISARRGEYRQIESENAYADSKEALLHETESNASSSTEFNAPRRPSARNRVAYLSVCLNIILATAVAILGVPQLKQYFDDAVSNRLIKSVSMPSPILDEIHIPYEMKKRDGAFLPGDNPSIFRQEPSEEVDDAWNRIVNINPIPVSRQYMKDNGYDVDVVSQWPKEYGLEDDAFYGRLDVFHEIHCLNTIRKEVFFDYYYGDEFASPKDTNFMHKNHISHCIALLLESLTCSASTTVLSHYWTDIQDEPYPDFSINRQCRDFNAVLKWQEENSVPMGKIRDVILKPDGVNERVMSLEYKYMMGLIKTDPAVNWTAAAEEKFTPMSNVHVH